MAMHVRNSGVWKNVNDVRIMANGSWRQVKQIWISKVDPILGQQWRLVGEYTAPENVYVPSPSLYRTDTRLVGDMDLRVGWQVSHSLERDGWSVTAEVWGDWFYDSNTKAQNVGYMDFVVPENQRGGQFTARVCYVNSRGSGPTTDVYYWD